MLVTFYQECVTEILAILRIGMTAFFNENELYTEPLVFQGTEEKTDYIVNIRP